MAEGKKLPPELVELFGLPEPNRTHILNASVENFGRFFECIIRNKAELKRKKVKMAWTYYLSAEHMTGLPEPTLHAYLTLLIKIGGFLHAGGQKAEAIEPLLPAIYPKDTEQFKKTAKGVYTIFSASIKADAKTGVVVELAHKDLSKLPSQIGGWYLYLLQYIQKSGGKIVIRKGKQNDEEHAKNVVALKPSGSQLRDINSRDLHNLIRGLTKLGCVCTYPEEKQGTS